MSTGEITIVVTLGVGFAAIMLALFGVLFAMIWQWNSKLSEEIRQSNSELRAEMNQAVSDLSAEMRETRNEVREQIDRLGQRVSDVELEQARIEERQRLHSHTHEAGD